MKRWRRFGFAWAFALALSCGLTAQAAAQEEFTAKVVGVQDGDTMTVLSLQWEEIKIRLAEIDAPESGQPFGQKSKKMLSDLAFGKEARIVKVDRDRYGRTVARVYVGETDVNKVMVEQGGAWAYTKYLRDPAIAQAETAARDARRGIWALQADQIEPPWEWRAKKRSGSSAADSSPDLTDAAMAQTESDPSLWEPLPNDYPFAATADSPPPFAPVAAAVATAPGGTGFACGGKSKCGDMASCEEATFHLKTCGLGKLDRDKDGVPCDSLCR